MSSIGPPPKRDGDTFTRAGASTALISSVSGGRGRLANSSSPPQPGVMTASATATTTAAHGILRFASTGLTNEQNLSERRGLRPARGVVAGHRWR